MNKARSIGPPNNNIYIFFKFRTMLFFIFFLFSVVISYNVQHIYNIICYSTIQYNKTQYERVNVVILSSTISYRIYLSVHYILYPKSLETLSLLTLIWHDILQDLTDYNNNIYNIYNNNIYNALCYKTYLR